MRNRCGAPAVRGRDAFDGVESFGPHASITSWLSTQTRTPSSSTVDNTTSLVMFEGTSMVPVQRAEKCSLGICAAGDVPLHTKLIFLSTRVTVGEPDKLSLAKYSACKPGPPSGVLSQLFGTGCCNPVSTGATRMFLPKRYSSSRAASGYRG